MPSMKASIGNPKTISLDDACILLSLETVGKDSLGQSITKEKPVLIFCSKLSITRAEHSAAGQLGYKPDIMLIVDSESYDNEKHLEYQGKRYSIYKNFMRVDGFTELYCEVNAND